MVVGRRWLARCLWSESSHSHFAAGSTRLSSWTHHRHHDPTVPLAIIMAEMACLQRHSYGVLCTYMVEIVCPVCADHTLIESGHLINYSCPLSSVHSSHLLSIPLDPPAIEQGMGTPTRLQLQPERYINSIAARMPIANMTERGGAKHSGQH